MWWWAVLGAIVLAVIYGYSIQSQIKVATPGCSSCPKKQNEDPSSA